MNSDLREADAKGQPALLALGILFVLTIGISFLPASWFGIQPIEKRYRKIDLSTISMNDVVSDSDKDGTLTWRDIVATNMTGDEIAEVRSSNPDPQIIATLNDPNNLTASFSKNLYVASTYLAKTEQSDPDAQQDALDQLIREEGRKMDRPPFTVADLTVAKSESKESVRAYGNAIAGILGNLITEKTLMDTIGSTEAYLETKDPSALLPLKKEYEVISEKITKLLSLQVPLSSVPNHLLAVNRLQEYAITLYNLSRVETDPLRSAMTVEGFAETALQTAKIYGTLSAYFDSMNIVFTSKEKGYVFTVGYTLP